MSRSQSPESRSSESAREGVARILDKAADLMRWQGVPALARVMEEITHMREYTNFLDSLGVGDWIDYRSLHSGAARLLYRQGVRAVRCERGVSRHLRRRSLR